MEATNGVYIMRVASMLTGMHPQTLRKYERAGLLTPSRSKAIRMYSEEDIARLKTIKYLVDEVGLNLAGVKMALKFRSAVMSLKTQLAGGDINNGHREHLIGMLNEFLQTMIPENKI